MRHIIARLSTALSIVLIGAVLSLYISHNAQSGTRVTVTKDTNGIMSHVTGYQTDAGKNVWLVDESGVSSTWDQISATTGTLSTANITTGTIASASITTGTITTATIPTLESTSATIGTLSATTGTIDTLYSTGASMTGISATTGIFTNLFGAVGTIANGTITTGTVTDLSGTTSSYTDSTATTLHSTDFDTTSASVSGTADVSTLSATYIIMDSGTTIDEFSTDGTFAGNSDTAVPTEKAVKTYVSGLPTTLSSIPSGVSEYTLFGDNAVKMFEVRYYFSGTNYNYLSLSANIRTSTTSQTARLRLRDPNNVWSTSDATSDATTYAWHNATDWDISGTTWTPGWNTLSGYLLNDSSGATTYVNGFNITLHN